MSGPTLIRPSRSRTVAHTPFVSSTLLLVLLFLIALGASPAAADTTVWATPHAQYSSSVGVLGCKINTNRVAYWPQSIDCTNICIQLSYEGRSVKLLRIDQSEGAYDVSYDAWNYLITGSSAKDKPTAGGATAMEYRDLDPSECGDLIHTDGDRLPLSAANSMNYLASCLGQPDSWVAKNYVLYNVLDPICSWGFDEECKLQWPEQNQASCASGLGVPAVLTSAPVYNIEYPSGKVVLAATNQVSDGSTPADSGSAESGHGRSRPDGRLLLLAAAASTWIFASLLCSVP